MSTMTTVRKSGVARTRGTKIPADHPFGVSSLAADLNGKGTRNDRRRYQARALRIAAKGI